MAIKLPAVTAEGKWTDLSYANAHKKCRLYEDGTLVINENRFEHADIALKHGKIVATYPQQNNLDYYVKDQTTNTTYVNQPWKGEKVTAVEFSTSFSPTSMRYAFMDMSALQTVNTANLDLSNCTSMQCAFKNCTELRNIDVSGFNVSKVTNMESAFFGPKYLKTLDVSNWNVSKVTDFRYMFRQCENLEAIDCSKWTPTAGIRYADMFRGCFKVTTLDVSNFDFSKATDIDNLFYQCGSLTTIYASGDFVVTSLSNINNAAKLFHQCNKLVGGNGTRWDSTHIDYTYAKIDREGTPGYLTQK